MITINQIRGAIRLTKEPHAKHEAVSEQLALSLKVYEGRGEFDGTLASAIECLDLAGYEIDTSKPIFSRN